MTAAEETPSRTSTLAAHGPRAARFAGVGVVNTGLDFMLFIAMQAIGAPALAANAAAFLIANSASYSLNARLAFRGSDLSLASYARFLAVHLSSLGISTTFIAVFADDVGALSAKLAAAAVALVWNYAGSAFFVFGVKGKSP